MTTVKSTHTYLVYLLGLLFLVLGIFGYLDIKNFTYSGYSSNDFTVTKVEESGPAAEAGMQVGDQIITINDLDVRDAKAWADQPRRKIGETRKYVVTRNGEEITFPVTFTAQPKRDSYLTRIGWTVGLIFLVMGLWAFRSRNTWASFLFAMFALGFAGAFMGGPHFTNNMADDFFDTMRNAFLFLSFAFLVDFLLHFPKKSSFVSSPNANRKLYALPLFLILFFVTITVLRSDASSGLLMFIRFLLLAFVVIYFGWALLIIFRNYGKASSEEKANGMSLLFWGTVIGLVPFLIAFIIGSLIPTVSFPGQDYMVLTMALIPICFALAITKNQLDPAS